MHVAIDAIPLSPGGGLTVLCGLARSLRDYRSEWRITVLTGNDATHRTVSDLGCVDEVRRAVSGRRAASSFLWQCTRLGPTLRAIGADVLLGFNHYHFNVPCPQIIYHLNLRRFCKHYRSRRPTVVVQEALRDRLAREALKRADANVFESHYLRGMAERLIRRPARGARVIYIGVPDELLSLPAVHSESAGASRRLTAITSPSTHKDNPTLIRTLAELIRRDPGEDWRLEIAGGTSLAAWEEHRRLAKELGLSNRITWHGFCDDQVLTTLLQSSLCLVSTSQLESFAMVALEAMARGCPPIVANCASMPESVGDAGLLARPGDPAAFAEAVLTLTRNRGLRDELVHRGYQWIRNFRWSECGREFGDLIHELDRTPDRNKRSTTWTEPQAA